MRPTAASPVAMRWRVIVAACLLAAGCSGIEPMPFPDERENPTLPGVYTGDAGEWVIYRKENEK